MKATVITIGDEILIGQIVNTNSVFLAKQFNRIGVEIAQITAISDQKNVIIDALDQARKRADIIIITGGLGPTKDDLTKHTLCEYFNDQLVKNEAVLLHIENIFKKEHVCVFSGDHTMGNKLINPPFDHIFFTGSPKIGKKVMEALKELDKIAYIRFASVYTNFKEIGEFGEYIEELDGQPKKKF